MALEGDRQPVRESEVILPSGPLDSREVAACHWDPKMEFSRVMPLSMGDLTAGPQPPPHAPPR